MQISIEKVEHSLVVRMAGELDHHSAARIRADIDDKILESKADKLIFDFSRVGFMDSSGIGVVMGRYKLMQTLGGIVVSAGIGAPIEKLMSVSGLRKIIPEFKTVEQALEYKGVNGI